MKQKQNGRAELKVYDGGNVRLTAFDDKLEFSDSENTNVTLSDLLNSGGGDVKANAMDSILVNFKDIDTFYYETSGRAQTADTS